MAFLPAVLLMMNRVHPASSLCSACCARPSVTTSAPPNQVLLGLALFLTFFVMSPTLDQAYETAWQPFSRDEITVEQFLDKGSQPFRAFMLTQTRQGDLALFARGGAHRRPARAGGCAHALCCCRPLSPAN
jgi:flagellar biosynthetic protein FliP